jgi:hypothetical protein
MGNIYSYGSYPGYTLGSALPPLPTSIMMFLELFQELVLDNGLHFQLLYNHLTGMRLMSIQFIGITSWTCT